MNPDTGHLIRLPEGVTHGPNGYELVPPELQHAANRKLAGKREAHVSLTSGGKLSRWAAQRRKSKKLRRKLRKRGRKLVQDFQH